MKKLLCLVFAALVTFSFLILPAYAAFADIPYDAWYASDVNDVQKYGLFNGVGNNKFDPQGKLSLAQAITLAARTHAYVYNKTIINNGNPWYQPYVNYALQNGIYKADEYGSNYNAGCSRMAMAVLFQRVFPKNTEKNLNIVNSIPDVTDSGSGSAVYYLYRQGVLTGSDEYGTFHPDNGITRAETAAILNRVLDSSKRKTFSLKTNSKSLPEFTTLIWKTKSEIIGILGMNYQHIYIDKYFEDLGYSVFVNDLYYKDYDINIVFVDEVYGNLSMGVEYYGSGHVHGKFDAHLTLNQLRELTGSDGYFGEDVYWDLDSNTLREGYSFSCDSGDGYGIKYFWKTDSTGKSPADFVWIFLAE